MPTDVERLAVLIEANTKSYENAMKKLQQQTDRALNNTEKRFKDASRKLESTFSGLGTSLSRSLGMIGVGVGSAQALRAIASASAEYVKLQNALKVTGLEGTALDRVMGSLFAIAQKNGTALSPLTTLYGRAAQAQSELKASSADLLKFTEGVSVALRVAGTDSTQAAGALLQLSQAIGSGVVRAEEFNSVNEGARPILQAVAAGLEEAGGSVSKLKNLVNEGKVSSEAFFRAFLAGMPQLEAQAAKASGTVGQATERMSNAFVMLVGKLDALLGVSGGVSREFDTWASSIQTLTKDLDGLGARFGFVQEKVVAFYRALGIDAGAAKDMAKKLYGVVPDGVGGQTDSFGDRFGNWKGGADKPANPVKPVTLKDFPVPGKDDKKGGTVGVDSFERAIAAAEKRIELTNAETATIGMNTAARERAKVAAELETAAKAANAAAGMKNTEVTAAQRVQIDATADAMLRAKQKNDDLTRSFDATKDAMRFAGEQTIDLLNAIGGTAEDRANALKNVLNQVVQAMLKASLLGEGPLAGLFGTKSATGGPGGLFGMLARTFSGGFATGGTIPAGKWGMTGEKGPEPIFAGARPVTVMPNQGGARAGGGSVYITNHNDFRGADPGSEARIKQYVDASSQRAVQQAVSAVGRTRSNSPGYLAPR